MWPQGWCFILHLRSLSLCLEETALPRGDGCQESPQHQHFLRPEKDGHQSSLEHWLANRIVSGQVELRANFLSVRTSYCASSQILSWEEEEGRRRESRGCP